MTINSNLPALSENSFLRYVNFIALYLAEGLQMGMLFVGIPAWMAMNNKTAGEIGGFAAACALPWTFKFLVAPLMDRYTYLPMGRKRPWVIAAQFGLIGSLITMGFVPDPLNNLQLFMGAAFLVSVFGATQDAAADGMAVDVIPAHQQARANGFMAGSRMIGSSLALAVGSWLLNRYNFTAAMSVIAGMVGVVTLIPIFLREQPGEKMAPWMSGAASSETKRMQVTRWATIFRALYSVFQLRNSLLVVLLMFITQGAYNFFETLLPLFTVKITGWTNVFYSQVFATADLIGGIAGMVVGGYLIERFGKKRMINSYFFLIIGITIVLAFLNTYWDDTPFVYGFIVTYRLLNAFAKIGVYAIAMQCCSKKVSASQFTMYMTMGAVGSMVGATLIGPVKENFSWEITFLSFVIMIGFAWLSMQFINIDKQVEQMTDLENEEAEREAMLL